MVGNHVRFLEARLGTLLLNRTTRRQSVTEFRRSYYERCRAILAEIEAAETAAETVQAVPRGLLRVTAPVTLGPGARPDDKAIRAADKAPHLVQAFTRTLASKDN